MQRLGCILYQHYFILWNGSVRLPDQRLTLWPFLKAGNITANVQNAELPSKYSFWSKYLSLPKYISLFDHMWLLCTLPSHPISIQVFLAASSQITSPLIVSWCQNFILIKITSENGIRLDHLAPSQIGPILYFYFIAFSTSYQFQVIHLCLRLGCRSEFVLTTEISCWHPVPWIWFTVPVHMLLSNWWAAWMSTLELKQT